MKGLSLAMLVAFSSLWAVAQNTLKASPKTAEPDFKNEGEQEDYWVADLFKNHYRRESYLKYEGKIIAKGDDFIYDGQVINVYAQPELKQLFEKGIIYPSLVLSANNGNDSTFKVKLIVRLSKSDDDRNGLAGNSQMDSTSVPNLDSLSMGRFEELKTLETSPHQKRFRCVLMIKGLLNPQLYYLEFSNEKATDHTDFATFMHGAALTFLRRGSVLI